MATILRPKVTIDIIPAFQTIQNETQKVLFVGQMTTAGSATAGQLYTNIENNNQEDALFGRKSMLATMIRAAKRINKISRFDAIPLDDAGAATASVGNIQFSGTASASGIFKVFVGSKLNNYYELSVANTDTADDIGSQLEALINADTTSLVTAVNTSGDVALTAVNKGLEGDRITLSIEGEVTNISVTLTKFTGGGTNPTLTNIFDVVGNLRYQTVIWPSTYDLTELTTFLDNRFDVEDRILDGVGFVSITDSFSGLKTTANAKNTQNLVILGNQAVLQTYYVGGAIFEMDYVIAAYFGAIHALRLSPDADISRYVISTQGALDSIGGVGLATKPYFNTPFYYLPLIDHDKQFTDEEVDELTEAGATILGNNPANDIIIAADVVTTYKRDIASNKDLSYKYLNYVDTASNIREFFQNNLRTRFQQSRLTLGDIVPGRAMANRGVISGYLIQLFVTLSTADYVLVPAGEDARNYFNQNKTIKLDLELGKVLITMKTPIVTQLRKIEIPMQLSFSTNS